MKQDWILCPRSTGIEEAVLNGRRIRRMKNIKFVLILVILLLFVPSVLLANGGSSTGAFQNGDFSDDSPVFWPGSGGTGYNHWRMEGYHNHFPGSKWDFLRTEVRESSKGAIKKGAPERYMEFDIVGAAPFNLSLATAREKVDINGDGDTDDGLTLTVNRTRGVVNGLSW